MSTGKGGGGEMPSPEDYMPLVQQQADINRLNQITPFGGTRYIQPDQQETMSPAPNIPGQTSPLGFDAWATGQGIESDDLAGYMTQRGYDQYSTDFQPTTTAGTTTGAIDPYSQQAQPTVEQYLSPELQSLYTQQFTPDAYQSYADDYMAESRRLLDPIYAQQTEEMQQAMANRGQPVGGELYSDTYADMMDAQNRGWQSAAFGAQQAGDTARMTDWNKLMSAMGGTQVGFPQTDVMGPASMAMSAQQQADALKAQQSSNMWNTAATVGTGLVMACSKDYKENKRYVSTLEKLDSIPVELWNYKDDRPEDGSIDHISPYAEDFTKAFGVGNGETIFIMDAIGVLMKAVQELSAEVKTLKGV